MRRLIVQKEYVIRNNFANSFPTYTEYAKCMDLYIQHNETTKLEMFTCT